eukprot:TRINITY_DN11481_c0_g1_i1.p1 TRINITY_DN11481_c0_g1~~TRINITY_DN11481_c0_g1_i1.p1  ORF type:complete len:238 (-),score=10.60 TRINITY_DN11481_c0_g1_i1:405-1118(-)
MPIEKKIQIEKLGEIALKRDSRYKRLSIRMAPDKGIWINLPNGISEREAIAFAEQNRDWVLRNKLRLEKKKTIFTEQTKFETKYHKLDISVGETQNYSAALKDGRLVITYPKTTSVINDDLQEFIRRSIIETLRREANYYLPKRIKELAEKFGFRYKSVSIKDTKSRWGSCSHDDKINLSLHLMRLPEKLIDMVILHELCHTRIKNHSSEFWDLLAQFCPNLKCKKKEIKNYSINII